MLTSAYLCRVALCAAFHRIDICCLRIALGVVWLLVANQVTNAQGCTQLVEGRAQDSCLVKVNRNMADAIIAANPQQITASQILRMRLAAESLRQWTNQYLEPKVAVQSIAVRHFKLLVLAGRYYEWGNRYSVALRVYQQADLTIPANNPLRARAGIYATELTNRLALLEQYVRRIRETHYSIPTKELNVSGHLSQASPMPKRKEQTAEEVDRLIAENEARWLSAQQKKQVAISTPHSGKIYYKYKKKRTDLPASAPDETKKTDGEEMDGWGSAPVSANKKPLPVKLPPIPGPADTLHVKPPPLPGPLPDMENE